VLLAMDYYLHQVHEGVVDYARRAGWILDARPQAHRQLPSNWEADGILTFIGSIDVFGPELRASGLPMVNMSPWGAEFGLPSVQLDNEQAGRLAADHLVSPHSEDAPPGVLLGWLKEQISALPRPVGVFTEGDLWAVEMIHICQQLGLRVPDDIAIVGIDNDPLVVDVAPVPVSSVDNNLHGLGMEAAALLDRLLSGEAPPAETIFIQPRGVVQRRSTNTLAVSNEDVAAAITFIHAHFRDPITVADVASESHISRRRLQDLFLEHIGRTISQEIQRARLDLAKRMLHESPMKIGLIAERCGLGSGVQMAKVFSRELKTTPKAYRQQNTPNRYSGEE
jgi:LacI family transcriptional regulator